jgi:F-type H+-transporting ATPase subunit gamma
VGAQLRVYKRRIRSVKSTKKITRAMELIAASRIAKAQQAVAAAKPYSEAITNVISAASSESAVDHPLLTERENPDRVAVLVVSSDRGLAGAYNANVLRTAEELGSLLREEGKTPVPYVIGRKAVAYYSFRGREMEETWTGFSEQPRYENAREVADRLISDFETGSDDGGVDEIHLVYTEFVSALSQKAHARRVLPLVVEYADDDEGERDSSGGENESQDSGSNGDGPMPLYDFEPSAEVLLDALLPRYIQTRVYAALLDAAAAESASRRRAMKAATDNATELIEDLTRLANAARQAEITQEISEIVAGSDALSSTGD